MVDKPTLFEKNVAVQSQGILEVIQGFLDVSIIVIIVMPHQQKIRFQ